MISTLRDEGWRQEWTDLGIQGSKLTQGGNSKWDLGSQGVMGELGVMLLRKKAQKRAVQVEVGTNASQFDPRQPCLVT